MNHRDPVAIWKQSEVPVVYKKGASNPLLVKLPYANGNGTWLKGDHRYAPDWLRQYKCWKTPKSWFDDVITRTLLRFHSVYVIQPFREYEKCAPACWGALGFECQCSCLGANHGSQNPDGKWRIVSDAFAIQWQKKTLACRLFTRTNLSNPGKFY
jgi:hypothetical protein